jgi:HSP20 family protein
MFESFLGGAPMSAEGFAPALDIAEKDDAILVMTDVPGVKSEDIDISVQGNTLTLSGRTSEEKEDRGEGYYHVERRSGSFKRSVSLPSDIDPDRIEASTRDGVLTITCPKSEKSKARKIEVKPE